MNPSVISNSISLIVDKIIEPSGIKDSEVEIRMEEDGKLSEEANEVEGVKRKRTAGEELIRKDRQEAKKISELGAKGVSEQPGASLRRGTAGNN